MINNVTLVGRLTKDPELRYTPSGVAKATFTLAVNRPFTQNGERQADFIQCVVWRKAAENTANFLKKGSLAGIIGRIETGSYDGQDGKRVYTTNVVCETVQFLEPKGSNGTDHSQNYSAPQQNQGGGYQQNQSYQQNSQGYQQNYGRTNQDPFANNQNQGGAPLVKEDDLPF